MPTDPRTWPAWKRALRAHRWFLMPRPPFNEEQQAYAHFAARAVVREVMRAFDLRRFPEKRWMDWLCRRAEAYARLSRRLRPRLTGPHDREWLRVYMRYWLFCGLRRSDYALGRRLPPDMWSGHSPLTHGPAPWHAPRRHAA